MRTEIPYVDYDSSIYSIDYEQARIVGEAYIKNEIEFNKIVIDADYDDTAEFVSRITDFINWDGDYSKDSYWYEDYDDDGSDGEITKQVVEKALRKLIKYMDNDEYTIFENDFYDDKHRGFIAGEFGLTDKEVEETEKRWFTHGDDYGYYQEVCQEIIEERKE